MKKIISIFFFLLVTACGFKPIFSSSETTFSINKIEYNNELGKVIYNNLKHYVNDERKKINYNLIIVSRQNKIISLKDKKGDAASFRLSVMVDLLILKNDKVKIEKTFKETFDYNNTSKKFELSRYEDEIRGSMLNKISEEIIKELYTIQ